MAAGLSSAEGRPGIGGATRWVRVTGLANSAQRLKTKTPPTLNPEKLGAARRRPEKEKK
jgi:hypothetical protein